MSGYPPDVTQWHIDYYAGGYDDLPSDEVDEQDNDETHQCDGVKSMAYAHVIARGIAYEETGDEDWSQLETSYGGGGYRIDREKLAALIASAIAKAEQEAERRSLANVHKQKTSEVDTDKFCPHGFTPRSCSECSY